MNHNAKLQILSSVRIGFVQNQTITGMHFVVLSAKNNLIKQSTMTKFMPYQY